MRSLCGVVEILLWSAALSVLSVSATVRQFPSPHFAEIPMAAAHGGQWLVSPGTHDWKDNVAVHRFLHMRGEPRNAQMSDFDSTSLPRGGERAVKLRGGWALGLEGGRFENVHLANNRSADDPFQPAKVMAILGGNWVFDHSEIAGAGTGVECPALIEVHFEDDDTDDPQPHPDMHVKMKSCVVRALYESELSEPGLPTHNLIYLGGRAHLDMEDCEIVAGDLYAMYLYGNSTTRISRSVIERTRTAFALDEHSSLTLDKCVVRDNKYMFHLWSPHTSLTLRQNRIFGQVSLVYLGGGIVRRACWRKTAVVASCPTAVRHPLHFSAQGVRGYLSVVRVYVWVRACVRACVPVS